MNPRLIALGNSSLVHAARWLNQNEKGRLVKLTVLHTNDVHSRIDPFPMDGGKNQGRGGAAKRADLIKKYSQSKKHVLLLDSGDMFQGTPYFNFFKGELEVRLMSKMGYDAATIGNHDFDGGIDNLHDQIKDHAQFSVIKCKLPIIRYSFTSISETL